MRSVADHIYDIAYNSIKAESKKIILEIKNNSAEKVFSFRIKDDGIGIKEDKINILFDPFYTTRDKSIRKVGLGLSLLKQNTEMTGGYVKLRSEFGKGTELEAVFKTSSMNIPEYGDISGTFAGLLAFDSKIEWEIIMINNQEKETITTIEIKDILGDDVQFNSSDVMGGITKMFENMLNELGFRF